MASVDQFPPHVLRQGIVEDEMTVKELHELASERELEGRSSMNKAELIDALRRG